MSRLYASCTSGYVTMALCYVAIIGYRLSGCVDRSCTQLAERAAPLPRALALACVYVHAYTHAITEHAYVGKPRGFFAYSSMLCFACGCILKAGDKRRLKSPEATNVVALWKHLALQDESQSESELDKLLVGNGKPDDYGKMCRKCFLAYQRLIEVADTLKVVH